MSDTFALELFHFFSLADLVWIQTAEWMKCKLYITLYNNKRSCSVKKWVDTGNEWFALLRQNMCIIHRYWDGFPPYLCYIHQTKYILTLSLTLYSKRDIYIYSFCLIKCLPMYIYIYIYNIYIYIYIFM
jgi:hypothetical protein